MQKASKTYSIFTIGCQMNVNDSERIASYLEDFGYKKTEEKQGADIVVFTTCGVRQSAEDRIYGIIPKLKENNPRTKIVLTGCLSGRADVQKRLDSVVDIWLTITELPKLGEKLGLEKSEENSLSGYFKIAPKYDSTFSALVPIGNGCDNFCSYCVVPNARGRETYRPAEDVINEAKDLIKRGYKELILVAQNVNSYKSAEYDFAKLFKAVNDLPGNFWLRFSTSHPKDMSDELIETISKCDKACRHIHLPAQAGDNEILRQMNRKYSIEHYKGLIDKIRRVIPDVAISTDIIVGYPGETDKQFNNTAELFREVGFDMAYLSQYSPRPGTAAEKMEDNITPEEKKRREEVLNDILSGTALSNNQKLSGQIVDVLIDSKRKDIYLGKTGTNKTVRVRGSKEDLIGKFVKVKIIEVQDFGMIGEVAK